MTGDLVALRRDDLCLAFANTLCWRGSAAPVEALNDEAALLDWVAVARPVPQALRRWLRAHHGEPGALLAAAIALREAVYRIFSKLAAGRSVAAHDLATFNRALALAPARQRLARAGSGCAWRVAPAGPARPARLAPLLLAPVLWSAGDLLAGSARGRVRCCANEQCLWLFLDQSKGGTRRWCDMASCGNRAKARRHYLKTRHQSTHHAQAGHAQAGREGGGASGHGRPAEL
jgi:predicted RNA-binding Zn ribbon-like protein